MHQARTESDLAEALATLERYAPDPGAVLRGLQRRPRRAAAWRRRPLVLAAAASAAAVALALVLALLVPSGRPAQPALPSARSVATAMLTSFHSVRGDVEYETQTDRGTPVDRSRTWSWPAQPVAGQRYLTRTLFSSASLASATVHPVEDVGIDSVVAPGGAGAVPGQVTMVCFLRPAQTGCGYGERDTRPGTWSRFTAPVPGGSDVGSDGGYGPSLLARGLAAGAWRVVGRAHLNGQPAIELHESGYRKGIPESLPGRLWVNARTYLPIRLVFGGTVRDFRYLPPTPANLALLRVPIPAGYPRS
jgi:hypothetical protein